ncbi:hypothetical protein D3C71_1187590 [compost metagenome]
MDIAGSRLTFQRIAFQTAPHHGVNPHQFQYSRADLWHSLWLSLNIATAVLWYRLTIGSLHLSKLSFVHKKHELLGQAWASPTKDQPLRNFLISTGYEAGERP